MKRSLEQEAARKERAARTAQMNHCGCGNVARWGSNYCGACDPAENIDREFEALKDSLRSIETRADLMSFLEQMLEYVKK